MDSEQYAMEKEAGRQVPQFGQKKTRLPELLCPISFSELLLLSRSATDLSKEGFF